jgi:hypothetical protein
MIRHYRRAGQSHVYWLTLPAARDRGMAAVFRTINAAIAEAARRAGATMIDLVPVLTPGRRYRRTMTVDGRTQVVRQADGVHLAHAGAQLASRRVRAVLQADGLLPAGLPPS